MATIERAIPVGANLNFKVVGGVTRPTNPSENTIWVDTDLEITGWAFDAEAPNYLATGGVWITVGKASAVPFCATKKNIINVYPQKCMQWDGSAWVTKSIYIYQSGVWQTVEMCLYNNGVSYAEWGTQTAALTTDGNLTLRSTVTYGYGRACQKTAFDPYPWTTLKAKVTAYSAVGTYANNIMLKPAYSLAVGGETGFSQLASANIAVGDVALDLTNINDPAFLFLQSHALANIASYTISKIWLE